MAEIRSSTDARTLTRSATDISNDDQVAQRKKQAVTKESSAGLAVDDSSADVGDAAAISAAQARSAEARAAVTSLPPTTPVASSTTTASSTQGAASFATQVGSIRYSGSDSDSMTAAFMKLDAENLSTNQDAEGYLNLASHYLRQAAFNIERALSGVDTQAMLDQAAQLEEQAQDMLSQASADDPQVAALVEKYQTDSGTAEAWSALYDSASRYVTQAAEANAAGDQVAAEEYEAKARTILESAGIAISDTDAEAMGELALQMKAEGNNGNVITAYIDQHPQLAKSILTADEYAAVEDKGGQAIVDAIMQHQADALGGADNSLTLGLALSAGDEQAVTQLLGSSAGAAGQLGQIADLFAQAYELRIRAYQTQEALLDAQNAIAEGKTAKGQFGVAEKNAVTQDEILRRLFALTGGTRADLQARDAQAAEAAKAQNDVAKLVLDFIDRQSSTQRTEYRS